MSKLPRLTEAEHRLMSERLTQQLDDYDIMVTRVMAGYPKNNSIFRYVLSTRKTVYEFYCALKDSILKDNRVPDSLYDELYQREYSNEGLYHGYFIKVRPEPHELEFTARRD